MKSLPPRSISTRTPRPAAIRTSPSPSTRRTARPSRTSEQAARRSRRTGSTRSDGSTVTLSKTAVAQFGKDGATYADFTFVMSKGQSPTLRVNYVTTYALTANVVDDLGLPISGATVTFTPNGCRERHRCTDPRHRLGRQGDRLRQARQLHADGNARALHLGHHADHAASPPGRTVKMTGEILETVQLVVTNEYGAPLSGAAVSDRRQDHHHRRGRHRFLQRQARQLCSAGGLHRLQDPGSSAFGHRFSARARKARLNPHKKHLRQPERHIGGCFFY